MSCDAFLERVEALLEGSLAPAERATMLSHLGTCAPCRELCAALAAAPETPPDHGLVDAILARTSGAACETARARLCEWQDGELPALDAELVAMHARACPTCSALARSLERLRTELPLLAGEDPGPDFIESVLRRTSWRARPAPFGTRLAATLRQLLGRPRAAWEGAYLVTAFLILPLLAPGSPLAAVARRGLDLVRTPPPEQRALAGLRDDVGELEASLRIGARSAWANAGAVVAERSSTLATGLTRSSASTWQALRESLGTFPGVDASAQKGAEAVTRSDPAQERKR